MINMKHNKQGKKSQVPVDFLISLTIFIIVLFLVSFTLVQNFIELNIERERETLFLLGFGISELLLYDEGYPSNWNNIYATQRIGFAQDYYKLSREKVLAINNCDYDMYNKIKSLLSVPAEMDIEILVSKINDEIVSHCGRSYLNRKFVEIRRIASIDNEIVLLKILIYH